MKWSRGLGFLSLAAALAVSNAAFAADLYAVSTAGFGGVDIAATPVGISNAGIDRLLEVNSTEYSVLGTREDAADTATSAATTTEAVTPLANVVDDAPSGMYLLAGVGAAFAMGLGLCFAGLMSGRKRTIHTFAAGFAQVK